MNEKDLHDLETKFEKRTGKDPTVSLPAGIFLGDINEYIERARPLKAALATGKRSPADTERIQGLIAQLKRAARARVIQRELNKMDGRPDGFITPWPDIPLIP